MKEISAIPIRKDEYDIVKLINNTALIKASDNKTGLINIKTGEIIWKLSNEDFITYSKDYDFYIQIKDSRKATLHDGSILSIYDAKKEKLIVDTWKIADEYNDDFGLFGTMLLLLEDSDDKKIHIFDEVALRHSTCSFNVEFDSVEFFHKNRGTYLLVTLNGKKGIYKAENGLIIPTEYDKIEKKKDIVIFTKDDKKRFAKANEPEKMSIEFDEIELKDGRFIHCRSGNTRFVYSWDYKEIYQLLKMDCEDVSVLMDYFENRIATSCLFAYKNNNKYGLVEGPSVFKTRSEYRTTTENTILLDAKYDEIKFDGPDMFYLKKDNKYGLYFYYYDMTIVEANYDSIVELFPCRCFAFYNGEYCDIVSIKNLFSPIVSKCKIVDSFSSSLIFEKNNIYGLLGPSLDYYSNNNSIIDKYSGSNNLNVIDKYSVIDRYSVIDNYDSIKHLDIDDYNGYFELEKNGKKGISYGSSIIVPLEYDEIKFHTDQETDTTRGVWACDYEKTVYFSLKKAIGDVELTKSKYCRRREVVGNRVKFVSDHAFEEIKFFNDIIVLRDKTNCYIYSYNEEKVLKVCPVDTEISMLITKNGKAVYCISDIYYFYINGKLIENSIENITKNSYNTIEDTEIDNKSEMKDSHPMLVKKIVPLKSDNK